MKRGRGVVPAEREREREGGGGHPLVYSHLYQTRPRDHWISYSHSFQTQWESKDHVLNFNAEIHCSCMSFTAHALN